MILPSLRRQRTAISSFMVFGGTDFPLGSNDSSASNSPHTTSPLARTSLAACDETYSPSRFSTEHPARPGGLYIPPGSEKRLPASWLFSRRFRHERHPTGAASRIFRIRPPPSASIPRRPSSPQPMAFSVLDPLHDANNIPEARFRRCGHGRRHCRIDPGGTVADFGSGPRTLPALGAFRHPGWPRKRQSGYRGPR
jgi:hypothetical protein